MFDMPIEKQSYYSDRTLHLLRIMALQDTEENIPQLQNSKTRKSYLKIFTKEIIGIIILMYDYYFNAVFLRKMYRK